MTIREVTRRLKADGWTEKLPRKGGSHRQYVHPTKTGKVTIAVHNGDIPIGTLKSILKQAGLE